MLNIKPSVSPSQKCTPNILPCRITHSGPVNATERYWCPENSDVVGKKTAYFRGRKLIGKDVPVPEGYKGIVVQNSDRTIPSRSLESSSQDITPGSTVDEAVDADEDEDEPVKVLEQVATFEEVVVWGHEVMPGEDETFVRGVGEWIAWAEGIHSFERPGAKEVKANA